MAKVLILYHSRTGNTQKMAEAVAEGVKSVEGVSIELKTDMDVVPEDLASFDAMVVGAPTYRHNMSIGIRNLFEEVTAKNINLKDKVGASFGSYGWSGEAPSLVFAILKDKFGMKMVESQLQIKNTPDDTGLEKCRELGKTIVNELMRQP